MSSVRILPAAPTDKALVREFVELPFRIYRGNACWVPWLKGEVSSYLQKRHPFFERSEAEFFLARRDSALSPGSRPRMQTVGRLAVIENRPFNAYHGKKQASFYFFEAFNDREAASALFAAACEWAGKRGLYELVGPYGFSAFSGGGLLVEGFENRAAMTMMNYHLPYYHELVEGLGFRKEKDLYSACLDPASFRLPERVRRLAELALKRGSFRVPRFRSNREILKLAGKIAALYNGAFAGHDDFCPLTEKEVVQLARDLLRATYPSLIKLLFYKEELAGFLFAFPDLSSALQRARGNVNPLTLLDILREKRSTDGLIFNGAGILPQYQNLGGNALLYYELERTVKGFGNGARFRQADLTQIAETTSLMLRDIGTLGGKLYKTHRIYRKVL